MSHPPTLSSNTNSIDLENIKNVSNFVRDILTKSEKEAERIIGEGKKDEKGEAKKTTISSYRRVHEIASSALEEVERGKNPTSAITALTKSLILVKYQEARGLLLGQLPRYIEQILSKVLGCMQEALEGQGDKIHECREMAKNGKMILDALAVLVYQYGKKG
jgi:hypothetical protein